jgi:hypothetical protein
MKTLMKIAFALIMGTGLMLSGCRKEKEDNDTTATSDNAFAEAAFNDLATIAEQGSTGNVSSFKNGENGSLLSHCASVRFDTLNSSNTDTLTIDFGPTNCPCHDGRNRRGKIFVYYTGGMRYRDSGLVATIVPSNYFVNNHQILGTKTVENKGHLPSSGNRLTWVINVNGSVIKADNGGTVTWTTNKTKVLVAGETSYNGPINWLIAKWELTGTVSGTAASGENFTGQTVTPLLRDMTCGQYRRFFTKGRFDFTPGNKPTRKVDFGNGDCDNQATVTIGNRTYTISMY